VRLALGLAVRTLRARPAAKPKRGRGWRQACVGKCEIGVGTSAVVAAVQRSPGAQTGRKVVLRGMAWQYIIMEMEWSHLCPSVLYIPRGSSARRPPVGVA